MKLESSRATTLAKATRVLQTPTFKKAVKKLKPNQKNELDVAIKALMAKPSLGEQKKGDLAFLRVHKFKMNKQLTLLGAKAFTYVIQQRRKICRLIQIRFIGHHDLGNFKLLIKSSIHRVALVLNLARINQSESRL